MNTRHRWALAWATWAGAFVVAETIALRSGHPDAPLCAHLRPVLGCRGGTAHKAAGAVAGGVFVAWFARHLYRELS